MRCNLYQAGGPWPTITSGITSGISSGTCFPMLKTNTAGGLNNANL